jgi:hypothetical protein
LAAALAVWQQRLFIGDCAAKVRKGRGFLLLSGDWVGGESPEFELRAGGWMSTE